MKEANSVDEWIETVEKANDGDTILLKEDRANSGIKMALYHLERAIDENQGDKAVFKNLKKAKTCLESAYREAEQ